MYIYIYIYIYYTLLYSPLQVDGIFWMDFADGLGRAFGRFRALLGRPRYRHCVCFVALYWMDQSSAPDVNSEAPNATCSHVK